MAELLDKLAEQSGRTRSDIVREALQRQLGLLLVGEVVIDELVTALRGKIGLAAPMIGDIESFLRRHEENACPQAPSEFPLRDPDDQWILASATDGRAEILVTGDRDLLDVAAEAPLRIVDPRGFWTLVRSGPPRP